MADSEYGPGICFDPNPDAAGRVAAELDWEVGFADSSIIRAHQHAAGARRRRAKADKKGARQRFLVRRSARAAVG